MQKKKGISLIVLVITIIVMIILAGSIIITLSNSGIINKANEAVDLSNDKQMQEYITSELILNGWYSGKPITKELLDEIDGVTVSEAKVGDKVVPGTWIVEKDGAKTTIYETGDIVKGEVEIWDGTSVEVPEIKEGNWYIYTPAQFKFFAGYVNNVYEKDNNQTPTLSDEQMAQVPEITVDTYVYLMADLDLGARQENGTKTVGTEWIPIGPENTDTGKFIGTFDGNNHIIRGVYVYVTKLFAGIFGNANTIKNLTIKDSYIHTTVGCAGGVVAALRTGDIENCHNINTKVLSKDKTGGIVGQFTGTNILECSNSGIVEAAESNGDYSDVGGIVGRFRGMKIEKCNNIADVTGSQHNVGGILGSLQKPSNNIPIITDCINSGKILGKQRNVGGIIGDVNATANIAKCINNGKVIGYGERVGGIAGETLGAATTTTIDNCINTAEIEGRDSVVGGIVGLLEGEVENCYNTGNIKSTGNTAVAIGGIVGGIGTDYVSVARNTYNTGIVLVEGTNADWLGGIVGAISTGSDDGTISNNYNLGKIIVTNKNAENVGAIVSGNTSYTINNNYYLQGISTARLNDIGEARTSAEMKTLDFVKHLNTGLSPEAWEIRTGQNSGYPVLIGLK